MRFVKLSLLNELRHCCQSLPTLHPRRRPLLFTSACSSFSAFNWVQTTPIRTHSTSWPRWKDATQPKNQEPEPEKLDLDIWKTVMRSQVAQGETGALNSTGTGDPDAAEEDEDTSQDSSLEATRELVAMWRLAGKLVPEDINDEQLLHVAELTTKSAKKKYLKFLAIKENLKMAKKRKQEEKRASILEEKQRLSEDMTAADEEDEGGSKLKNTFLVPFWQRSLDKLLAWRCVQAMRFGQPLVFDMSYEEDMSKRELDNAIAQLVETEGWNRRSQDPFHLHFCNLDPEGGYYKELLKRYGQEAWERLLITASPQRYVDLFPRQQLVYLTSDSPNILRTFDHNKVYIVGALVDRSSQPGLSLANAKRLKLATARLPLDEHLDWECGAKNLSLDQMIRILLTAKQTGNWEQALAFVPTRKHTGFHSTKRAERDVTKRAERDVTKRADRDSGFKERRENATTYADRQHKNLFISKQRSKPPPGVRSAVQGSPVEDVLKRKLALRPPAGGRGGGGGAAGGGGGGGGAQRSGKNWWEEK
ncbi:tRNA methyltransferase 10 homolog C [Engraulis encrasicolus]|uniref:tRNA methyltransferase 10 homolog C n=1 Tax=Engraulis encrasicolus TaxID=184585 RepID=UPI002FD02E5C